MILDHAGYSLQIAQIKVYFIEQHFWLKGRDTYLIRLCNIDRTSAPASNKLIVVGILGWSLIPKHYSFLLVIREQYLFFVTFGMSM